VHETRCATLVQACTHWKHRLTFAVGETHLTAAGASVAAGSVANGRAAAAREATEAGASVAAGSAAATQQALSNGFKGQTQCWRHRKRLNQSHIGGVMQWRKR
jgi:hypothetical protein